MAVTGNTKPLYQCDQILPEQNKIIVVLSADTNFVKTGVIDYGMRIDKNRLQ